MAGVSIPLGLAGDLLFHGRPLGLNVFLWVAAFVGALAMLLRIDRAPLHQGRRWMAAPLLLFAAAFVWHDSRLLEGANLLALAGAVVLGALRRTEPQPQRAGVGDYAAGLAAAGAGAVAGAIHLFASDIKWDEVGRGIRTPRVAAVGKGLAIGSPLLLLFGWLFVAADAVFKGLVAGLVPSLDHPLVHALIVGGFAWFAAGLLRDLAASREEARLVSPATVQTYAARWSLGTTELAVVLAVLNLLFLAFVLVQLRYLFGGAGLVAARAHLTYAQYARHGFFELVAVSILVLPLLLAVDALRRKDEARGRLVPVLSAGLIALVLVVMASALQRMRLYEQAYGLTELRLYATGVILWLAVVLLWFCATALRGRRRPFAFGALLTGFAATAVLNVANPDALIARTNLSRPHLDAAYVGSLADDALPTVLERLPGLAPAPRQELARALLARRPARDWRSFNLSRARGRTMLAQHRAELERLAR
ncbi:MAG: hypothetical protein QOE36_1660 [Gaiellaceae bacterium]|nr:hypothetical protein [Gaiellaceae bacterium]